jgi:hypothetical protein
MKEGIRRGALGPRAAFLGNNRREGVCATIQQ